MRAKLNVVKGAKPTSFAVKLPAVIGRGADADVKLPASTVSRQHCELYLYENALVVRDLGSSNGCIVNGQIIQGPTYLTPSDELTIGPVTITLEMLPAESSAAPMLNPAALQRKPSATNPAVEAQTSAAEREPPEQESSEQESAELELAESTGETDVAESTADASTNRDPTNTAVANDADEDSKSSSAEPSTDNESIDGDILSSIVTYTEQETGSFVGIEVSDPQQVQPVEELPPFDGLADSANKEVTPEDSALHDFFKKLD